MKTSLLAGILCSGLGTHGVIHDQIKVMDDAVVSSIADKIFNTTLPLSVVEQLANSRCDFQPDSKVSWTNEKIGTNQLAAIAVAFTYPLSVIGRLDKTIKPERLQQLRELFIGGLTPEVASAWYQTTVQLQVIDYACTKKRR